MLFYVLGEMMSLLIGKLIPGSVCGMILLFIALKKFSDTNCERDTATARKWGNQPKRNRGMPPLSRERGYRELALFTGRRIHYRLRRRHSL